MRYVVLSEHDAAVWSCDHAAGLRSSSLPYGIDALGDQGHRLTFARQSQRTRVRSLWAKAEHRVGGRVELALRANAPAMNADAVIALLEYQAVTASALRRHRVGPAGRRPLIMLSCWLAEWIARAEPRTRSALVRRYAGADLIVTWSANQLGALADAGFAEAGLAAMPFGVDTEFYAGDPHGRRPLDILAVGQDAGRDYGTLFSAVAGTDLHVDLVCKPQNLVGLTVPSNVTVHGTVPHARYRQMLREAKVVAVPTHEFQYPTGQSVAMEAAAAGAAIVVTGTRPMREYFDDSIAVLPTVGAAESWRDALHDLLGDDDSRVRLALQGQSRVRERFDTAHSWEAFSRIVNASGIGQRGCSVAAGGR